MTRMFNTSLDILYISLAVGFLVFVIFASVALLYLTFVLRNVDYITMDVRKTTGRVNELVESPFRILMYVLEHFKSIVATWKEKREDDEEEEGGKKSK